MREKQKEKKMSALKYTKDHEWIEVTGNKAKIGISDHARDALGDLVFLELPDTGRTLSKGEDFAVIESVKAASEVYSPISGEITSVNESLADSLDDLKEDTEKGWIIAVEMSNPSELEGLMDKVAYDLYLGEL